MNEQATGASSVAQAFNIYPGIPPETLTRIRRRLTKLINASWSNISFVERLRGELMKNLTYSPWLTWEVFSEIHGRLEKQFAIFFDGLSARQLFAFFDEDLDQHLHEDEQILVFTVLNAKFSYLLQEINFYGVYELDPKIKGIMRELVDNAVFLEQKMRVRFYDEQHRQFTKLKENRSAGLQLGFQKKAELFEEFTKAKVARFEAESDLSRTASLERFRSRKSNFNFNKYSMARNLQMQEKLLGLGGSHEEARYMFRNFQRFLERESEEINRRVLAAYHRIENSVSKELSERRDILDSKLEREKEKLIIAQRGLEMRNDQNNAVQTNKLLKVQDELSSSSTNNFLKACVINQIKSEQNMRKDFSDRIISHLHSSFKESVIHSSVFRNVFGGSFLSFSVLDSPAAVLSAFEAFRDSHFNVRMSLRNLEEKPLPINVKYVPTGKSCNKQAKIRAILKEESRMADPNTFRLTELYDDNLNEI